MSGLVTFVKIMERSAIPEHLIVILSAVGDRLARSWVCWHRSSKGVGLMELADLVVGINAVV
jgi:hypothetical protein